MNVSRQNREDALARFKSDTADHEMKILMDNGIYRHLRFQNPQSGNYWFEVVTWPGALAIRGEMDDFMFQRLTDMFEFFRRDGICCDSINPHYWAEKVIAGRTMDFDRDLVIEGLIDQLSDSITKDDVGKLRQELEEENIDSPNDVHDLMNNFEFTDLAGNKHSFYYDFEFQVKDFTFHYLWCCHAIVDAIRRYDERKGAK